MKATWILLVVCLAACGLACSSGETGTDEDAGCVPNCEDKECGDDGCGGSCGDCGEAMTCTSDHLCSTVENPCLAACDDLECGDGGVAGCNCGECGFYYSVCNEHGRCEASSDPCHFACEGRECGDGGVEGCLCGVCTDDMDCIEDSGTCGWIDYGYCGPSNDPYECGDDGYGSSCGDCPKGGNWYCEIHKCECDPDCDDRECGPDGCGETCGSCDEEMVCDPLGGQCGEACYWWAHIPSGPFFKLNLQGIGAGGHPGEALDIDDDPGTCAPPEDCSDGRDHSLSSVTQEPTGLIDLLAELRPLVWDDEAVLLLAHAGPFQPETFYLLLGTREGMDTSCDTQAELCGYLLRPELMDATTCDPLVRFELTSSGEGSGMPGFGEEFSLQVQVIPDYAPHILRVWRPGFTAKLDDWAGDDQTWQEGVLGGAFHKQDLLEIVDALPDDFDLPISSQLLKGMLDMFLIQDIDADGDGTPESVSFVVRFTSIPASLSGVAEID